MRSGHRGVLSLRVNLSITTPKCLLSPGSSITLTVLETRMSNEYCVLTTQECLSRSLNLRGLWRATTTTHLLKEKFIVLFSKSKEPAIFCINMTLVTYKMIFIRDVHCIIFCRKLVSHKNPKFISRES